MTRGELNRAVVGNQIWQSFAAAKAGGAEKFDRHPDPDARLGTNSWYMPREKFAARIKASLEAGHASEVTIGGHTVLLYGADYDADGAPVRYYIKDSYPNYFYESDAAKLHSSLMEITTAL